MVVVYNAAMRQNDARRAADGQTINATVRIRNRTNVVTDTVLQTARTTAQPSALGTTSHGAAL